MRWFFALVALLLIGMLVACQGAPPSIIYVVVTSTPEGTLTAALPTPSATLSEPPTATLTPTPAGPTPLPPIFPTPVTAQIQVAEQLFEGGRMFWVQPTRQIWVMVVTSEGRGTWTIYEDTFAEGDIERDPALIAPAGRSQPERGFGKLWRESDDLRDLLGWAVTPEFGYVSAYEYNAGGTVTEDGTYSAGPGYHILFSLSGEQFRFNEIDGTWQLGGG